MQFVNSKKNDFRLGLFFRIPSPRILRQVGRVHILRSWYFFKARYPAPGHKCKRVLLQLCPAAGYLALKKYRDLEI